MELKSNNVANIIHDAGACSSGSQQLWIRHAGGDFFCFEKADRQHRLSRCE
jgi:hypothetical protein